MHIKLSGADIVAIENTPESQDDIRNLAEGSTTRRPAYLPEMHGEPAKVWLAEQRSMVNLPDGHNLVALPSGAVVVLSPGALASICT
ncbi:hypothetical protein ABZ635_21990 [Nocardiopsis sp. NPDC007018]|uniref:hypothetical protein n=1 Tax=Nocardiopsis sp. NPDC007018 TaxID=3155721 RepID=UPI003406410C